MRGRKSDTKIQRRVNWLINFKMVIFPMKELCKVKKDGDAWSMVSVLWYKDISLVLVKHVRTITVTLLQS